MKPTKLQDRHGAMVSGLGKSTVKMGGVGIYPQQGNVYDQDVKRKVSEGQVGDDSGPRPARIPKNNNKSKTGGMNRKFAGKIGFQKATGTT